MNKLESKFFQKFEYKRIFEETLNKINGVNLQHPAKVTGDHECTNGRLDCSDDYNSDVFEDSIFKHVESDGCY